MSTPVEQAKVYVEALNKAGVRAVWDPRKVAPPCALFVPPTVEFDTNCGGTASWTVYLLAATTGTSDAWSQLDALMVPALKVLPVERVTPNDYRADSEAAFPAYICTWDEQVEWS